MLRSVAYIPQSMFVSFVNTNVGIIKCFEIYLETSVQIMVYVKMLPIIHKKRDS